MKPLKRLLLTWLAIVSMSCADAPRVPTQPSEPSPGLDTPRLSVTIDGDHDATAILAASQVVFDASETKGDKLRFEIRFGDGESSTGAVASHVYKSPGTFKATVVITDAAGRQSSTSKDVVVAGLSGAWFSAGINPRAQRFEARRFAIVSQDGPQIRGTYSFWDQADRPFVATIDAPRKITLTADGGAERLEGQIPAVIGNVGFPLVLTVVGGSADGQVLPFTPVATSASVAPPHAHMEIRSEIPGHQFFTTPGLMAGWDATFDASRSTGDGLSYFIEFGDGDYANAAMVHHAPLKDGYGTARAIVVDRFGHVDAVSQQYLAFNLLTNYADMYLNDFMNPVTGRSERRIIRLFRQDGRRLTGAYTHPEGWTSPLTATLSGGNAIQIHLDDGTIDFSGIYYLQERRAKFPNFFRLSVRGGSADGASLEFNYYDPY